MTRRRKGGDDPVDVPEQRISDGLLRLDAGKVAADAKLDGEYLLRTDDPRQSGEDIVRCYRQTITRTRTR